MDLQTTKEAACYSQAYIRPQNKDWHDLEVESGPNAGYGFPELLRISNNAIRLVSEFTDEHFS